MAINWSLLQVPDIGGAFQRGFDQGRTRNALSALGSNPDDRQAMNALMGVNPEMAFQVQDRQYRQQRQQLEMAQIQQEQQKALQAEIGEAIKWADTPEKWEQAVSYFEQKGIPGVSEYRGQFAQREALALQMGQIGQLTQEPAKLMNIAPGGSVFDPVTRQPVFQAPFAPQYRTVGEGQSLVEVGPQGGAESAPPPSTGPVTGQQIQQLALATVPGAIVTSGARTPERNRAVGGAPNSYHLTDQARDLVPPQGMTTAQLAQTLRGSMPGFQVIDEGDHVHVEPARGRQGGGARVIAQGTPKQGYQMLTPQEAQAMGLDATTRYQRGPNGQVTAVGGQERAGAGRKAATDLRKEFNSQPQVKAFNEVRASAKQIAQLARNPSPQSDIAMIFSFMKMLDPDSVVREGEFATAMNTAGVSDRLVNIAQRLDSGKLLNNNQRNEIVKAAYDVFRSRAASFNNSANQYRGYAQDYGIDPDAVARPVNGEDRRGATPRFTIVARRPK